MIGFVIAAFVGLMVGWFFLPAPAWAVSLNTAILEKIPYLNKFVKK